METAKKEPPQVQLIDARGNLGVHLQLSNYKQLLWESCYWTPT